MIFILLPAYNEELNILNLLQNIQNYWISDIKKENLKVVVVNDGSTDKTHDNIENFKKNIIEKNFNNFAIINLKHTKNKGLGEALKTGFDFIINISKESDILITMDSDNSHPIKNIREMIQKIKEDTNITISSRYQKGSKITGVPLIRIILAYVASIIFRICFPIKNVKDYTCGFRAYDLNFLKNAYKNNVNLFSEKNFSSQADILLKLRSFNKSIKVEEISMDLRYDLRSGKSKMNVIKNIFDTLLLILKRLKN
tara:strand:- start:1751 stop:2515 length:765 start_codon:yes stop_codon:yes gene_type:complete